MRMDDIKNGQRIVIIAMTNFGRSRLSGPPVLFRLPLHGAPFSLFAFERSHICAMSPKT
jgi:hypothetical protein